MILNLKKSIVVGVSVTPEAGLEVAQIDYETKTVLKYSSKPIVYDNNRKEIADLDIFKETLQDLFFELGIPKGSDVVVNIPSAFFKVVDYPASLDSEQITIAIEEDLATHPIFQNTEHSMSAVALPNSTIQFNKIAYTVASKTMLIEMALQIKDLGYNLIGIDTSPNSILNALIYNERIDTAPDFSWVLLVVENNYCKIFSMIGKNYVDVFDERISIGEVLGDEENISTIIETVAPILKNLPSKCLYVVSKTNVISAKKLANHLSYNAPIIHQEANVFATDPFLNISDDVDSDAAKSISLDVIGAAIFREFEGESNARFNLFNESLGDIYTSEQPPVLKFGSLNLVLSMNNMILASIILAIIVIALSILVFIPINTSIGNTKSEIDKLNAEISSIQRYLDENKNVSTALFDEGDEIRMGLAHNKNIYSFYTIVGTEIPKKLWLTSLKLDSKVTIEGQSDNLESVYSFFRNIKDYNPESNIKLQKLGFATKTNKLQVLTDEEAFDTNSIINSINADFYEFKISNEEEAAAGEEVKNTKNNSSKEKSKSSMGLPSLDSIKF